ncbi:Iroquois-class homeodomain IRX-6 [Schistosoma japonicum]|uniref:Iroquois-class homeodomain IRX-6 n=1 Tax=Schistosoma japonicum TaxID=6182 RepID=A0A4Z2CMG0_SCHJA|nr:Iroquois-class homeodomain IRX-6 [Schistosoma japonicum]
MNTNPLNDYYTTKMFATNDVNKFQYDKLLTKQSNNHWLPLPHPCVFTSNWSSLQFNPVKHNYQQFSCLHSKRQSQPNSLSPWRQYMKQSNMNSYESELKDSKLKNHHDYHHREMSGMCETDSTIIQDTNTPTQIEYSDEKYETLSESKKAINVMKIDYTSSQLNMNNTTSKIWSVADVIDK